VCQRQKPRRAFLNSEYFQRREDVFYFPEADISTRPLSDDAVIAATL
jgi:hypothetical protein